MNPGRARNELVPNGLARIVPWKRNLDRTNDVEEVSGFVNRGIDRLTWVRTNCP